MSRHHWIDLDGNDLNRHTRISRSNLATIATVNEPVPAPRSRILTRSASRSAGSEAMNIAVGIGVKN